MRAQVTWVEGAVVYTERHKAVSEVSSLAKPHVMGRAGRARGAQKTLHRRNQVVEIACVQRESRTAGRIGAREVPRVDVLPPVVRLERALLGRGVVAAGRRTGVIPLAPVRLHVPPQIGVIRRGIRAAGPLALGGCLAGVHALVPDQGGAVIGRVSAAGVRAPEWLLACDRSGQNKVR